MTQLTTWPAKSPLILGYIALFVLVGGFGVWGTVSKISGAIVTTGRLEVSQNHQVVQHLDGGVVVALFVDEGDQVEAGQTLLKLDPTLLTSNRAIIESQLFEMIARRGRLSAERDGVDHIKFDRELQDAADLNPDIQTLISGQTRLFMARAATLRDRVAQLRKQQSQIGSQIEGYQAQTEAVALQHSLIAQELSNQRLLLSKGLAQSSRVLALEREQASLGGKLGELEASKAQAEGRMTEIDIEIGNITTLRREESITRLRDLRYRELELSEKRRALLERLSRLDIQAPVSGVVYGLRVFAEQSVIRAADPVLYIVPRDGPLVIAVQVSPIHIDQVFLQQDVTLRFSSFSQRTTPELFAKVTQISADAFQDETTGLSYYRAEIVLNAGEMAKLPDGIALIPGMPVDAFLKTEDRSPLAYLIKPFSDYFVKAFRET